MSQQTLVADIINKIIRTQLTKSNDTALTEDRFYKKFNKEWSSDGDGTFVDNYHSEDSEYYNMYTRSLEEAKKKLIVRR